MWREHDARSKQTALVWQQGLGRESNLWLQISRTQGCRAVRVAPSDFRSHSDTRFARGCLLGFVFGGGLGEPPHSDFAAAAENCIPRTPLHLVIQAFELQLEPHPSASSRATSGGTDGPLRVFEFSLLIMRIQLLAGWTFVLEHPHTATSGEHLPAGPGCAAQVSWHSFC